MYTEDEAKELWCPVARAVRPEHIDVAANQIHHRNGHITLSTCCPSKCSMWRWTHQPRQQSRAAENPKAITEDGAGKPWPGWVFMPYGRFEAHWTETPEMARDRWRGYCGLAPLSPMIDTDPRG